MTNVLHILSQKPFKTGSGVFFTNCIEELDKKGYNQAAIFAVEKNEEVKFNTKKWVLSYPVYFSSDELPFLVVGMSDVMPYNSTRYIDLNEEMLNQWINSFREAITKAVEDFKPDVIICHHLYLLTALIRNMYPDKKIIGVCHATDIRQLGKHELMKEFILENINKLDCIFAHHEAEKREIVDLFNIEESKVKISYIGYNDKIFYPSKDKTIGDKVHIVFTGKVSKAKGVEELIKAYSNLPFKKDEVVLYIVGDGKGIEYDSIRALAKQSKLPIEFKGILTPYELADLYRKCEVFILPSFYEGMPLVLVEALASGMVAIVSNLRGIKEMLGEKINKSNRILYLKTPRMKDMDIPYEEDLPQFIRSIEENLIEMVNEVKSGKFQRNIDFSNLTWEKLSEKLEEEF